MPLTASEKSKRYREKLKERISPDEYKRRDRERKKTKRQSLSDRELKKLRAAHAKNQRKYRQKVCEKENLNCSVQSLGKAAKRVIETLPNSPRKRTKVFKILAEKFAACDTEVILAPSGCQGLPKSTLDAVTSHFCQDDISWQSPSRKDVIAIKANGEKKFVAKRFLRMSLKECHALYLERNPADKIGLTKFTLLRPRHVSLSRDFPHNLCICKYHENARLLLQALKKTTSSINIHTEFRPFIESITCNQENENCMFRRCDACVSMFDDVFFFPAAIEETTMNWYQWTSVEGHMEKVEQHGTLHECVALLREQTPSFLVHTFIKRQQSKFFEAEKQKADDEYAVIQVDFAENFAIVHQDEIQSAHWSHKQITLFTCCAHVGDSVQSYVIVSDELNHGKYEVAEFLDCIIRDLQAKFPGLNRVSFFSDGATSQFKQKYLFENITYFKNDYNISCSWNFFATSHGKGAVDGIGGVVKNMVFRKLKLGAFVNDAESFTKVAMECAPRINIKLLLSQDILKNKSKLDGRWEKVKTLPNTHSVHFVKPVADHTVKYATYSSSSDVKEFVLVPSEVSSLPRKEVVSHTANCGDFVLVKYVADKSNKLFYYVALVTEVQTDGFLVTHLFKNDKDGKVFVVKEVTDKVGIIDADQVMAVLPPPYMDNRERYHFEKAITDAL